MSVICEMSTDIWNCNFLEFLEIPCSLTKRYRSFERTLKGFL
jgi:hypothetical protein